MRLTTKIIAGIILSIFLLSLLFIIGYSFTDRKNYNLSFANHTINIPQEDKTGIDIEPFRVLVFKVEQSDIDNRFYYNFTNEKNGLFIHPATTPDEENKLFIPEVLNDFISIQTSNDTLTIKIKFDEVREKYAKMNEALEKRQLPGVGYGIYVSGVNLYLHTSNINVINKLNDIQTQIINMKTDSVKIYSSGDINIDSCKAAVMEPNTNRKLTVKNSEAKTIYMDLDRTRKWNIDGCVIEEQNVTGSGRHDITFHRNETGKINWYPKNENAELNLKFKGNAAQITYETQPVND